jgi:hypothetical protein
MLLFITSAANVLGWEMLTDGISAFMAYLPTLGISLIIFIIGVYIADLVKNMVYTAADSIGVSGAKAIANIVYYLLFIFIAITALNQAGINTEIITSNHTCKYFTRFCPVVWHCVAPFGHQYAKFFLQQRQV